MTLNWLLKQDQRLRAAIEEQVVYRSDGNFIAAGLASYYLGLRYRVMRWIIRRGMWHQTGLNVTMALALEEGDIFFDIGANVGWVTAAASYLVGAQGRVHSFEPSPAVIRHLHRRVQYLNRKNVKINEFALGDKPGEAILHEFEENFGGASSLRSGAWPGHRQARETSVSVKVLDDYVRQEKAGAVRLIKIDVQGAEIDVLLGARQLLASDSPPVLYVEVEQVAQSAFGRTIPDLLSVISELGYEMYSWRDDGLNAVKTEADVLPGGHDDVICLKPNRHLALRQRLVSLAEKCPRKAIPE